MLHRTVFVDLRVRRHVFEADGLLKPDVYSKRIASRLLSQLRMSEHVADASAMPDAGADVSQRLAQDLLFFCAQAVPADAAAAPCGSRTSRRSRT